MAGRGRALVVGGGVAGLSWALDAVDAGLDVTVLERDDRFGGVVRSEMLGPVLVDVGAESFALTRPDLVGLADRLGLREDVVRPSVAQAHVMRDGRLMPLPPGLLGIPADADDIARLLGADIAAEARARDAAPVPESAPETIGQLVRERLGGTVAEVLVDPVLAGVHATRADDAELASVAPSLHTAMRNHGGLMPAVRAIRGPLGPAGTPVATLTGGMGRLVERLRTTLEDRGVKLQTATEVTSLRHGGPASSGAGREAAWHVRTPAGELDADVLCLAVPARVAAGLLRTATLLHHAAELAASLDELPVTDDVLLVTLLIEDAALARAGAPVGSGVLVADDTVRAKAMTHASAKCGWLAAQLPPDHHVLRLSYGGTHDVGTIDPDRLVATARADLLRLLDGAAEVATVRASLVTRWQGALTRPVVGRAQHLAHIDRQLALLPRLALTGSALAGNGLAGVVGRSVREAARTL